MIHKWTRRTQLEQKCLLQRERGNLRRSLLRRWEAILDSGGEQLLVVAGENESSFSQLWETQRDSAGDKDLVDDLENNV